MDPEGIGGLSYVQLAPNVDESLWREVVKGHPAAADRVRYLSGPLHAQSKLSVEYPSSESPPKADVVSLELVVDGNRWRYARRVSGRNDVVIATPGCSFTLVQYSDDEAWQLPEGTQVGTQLWDYRLEQHAIVTLACPVLHHYALVDGDWAVWNASSRPLVNRLERVSRDGRDLVLVAFENRGEFDFYSNYGSYTSGELWFDPASCWAIRFASLQSPRKNGDLRQIHSSFEFHPRKHEPPLLRSREMTFETAGKETAAERFITEYDFDPHIAADDFSPAKYGLTSRPRGLQRSPSLYLLISVALVGLSIGGGALALLVDRWLTHRRSVRNSAASSGTETSAA